MSSDKSNNLSPNDVVFQRPDADLTLRTSDGKDFQVHKILLSIASKVFADMFTAPSVQSPNSPELGAAHNKSLPVVQVSEDSATLGTLLTFIYPISRPTRFTTPELHSLLAAADKYDMPAAAEAFSRELVSEKRGLPPLVLFALAKKHGFQDIAGTARSQILRDNKDINQLLRQSPRNELKLISAYDILLLLQDLVETQDRLRSYALNQIPSRPPLKRCTGCGKNTAPSWWRIWSSAAEDMLRASPSDINAIFDKGFMKGHVNLATHPGCDHCWENYLNSVSQHYLVELSCRMNNAKREILGLP